MSKLWSDSAACLFSSYQKPEKSVGSIVNKCRIRNLLYRILQMFALFIAAYGVRYISLSKITENLSAVTQSSRE